MNKAEILQSLGTIRQVELQRVATWMLREMLVELDDLNEMLAELAMASPQRRRVTWMQSEVEDLIEETLEELRKRIESDFTELLEITEVEEKRNFLFVYGLALVGATTGKGSELLIHGATVADHLRQARQDLIFRIMSQVRDSVAAGEAEELLWRRLKGSLAAGAPIGEMMQTKRRVEALVRTGMDAIPNTVATELRPSANVISPTGYQHVSVLDRRTSDICRARAWKRWDAEKRPIGHSLPFRLPPLHDHCRSRMQTIFIDDPLPQQVTFKAWVMQMSPKEQSRVFGAENFQRWNRGLMTDAELVRQQNRPMTIDALREVTNQQVEFTF